jgi:hypothetical protein
LEGHRNEPAHHSRFLLSEERVTTDEVPLVELRHPAEASFERRMLLVEITAVERVSHFQAKRITSPEANRDQAGAGALIQ